MDKKKHKPHHNNSPRINNEKTINRILVLCAAYLMEEDGYDDEHICDFYESMIRWCGAVDTHLITIDQVIQIIKDHTGMEILL